MNRSVSADSMPSFVPDPLLYPFESRWFEGTAGRMHYLDEGPRSAPAIVMCHGNPTWSFLYSEIITRLRGRFRCIAPDTLGMGLSERPPGYSYSIAQQSRALGELVDHLELENFVLMGQDWGGPTGLGMAVELADRVRGVVLGSTWFWFIGRPRFRAWSAWAWLPPGRLLMRHTDATINFLLPALTTRTLTPQEMDHYRGVQTTSDLRIAMATKFPRAVVGAKNTLDQLERDVTARLVDKPALIITCRKDAAFQAVDRERLRGYFTDKVDLDLPEACHYFLHDAPQEVAEAIERRFG